MLKIKFNGYTTDLVSEAKNFENDVKELLTSKDFKGFSFKFESGSVERLAAGQSLTFPKLRKVTKNSDGSDNVTGVLTYKLKKYEIGENKSCGIVLYPVEMGNGANEASLSMFNDLIKEKHLGTNKALQAASLCRMLEGQTIYIKYVYYEYIKPTNGNIFAVRHIDFTDDPKDITAEDIKTTSANIEAYKAANGNFDELYNSQETAKTQTTTTTSRSRSRNK